MKYQVYKQVGGVLDHSIVGPSDWVVGVITVPVRRRA